jgi:hypothetical protein
MNITLLLKQLVGPTYLYIVLGIVCYRKEIDGIKLGHVCDS